MAQKRVNGEVFDVTLTSLDTQLAGENLTFDWQKQEAGATQGRNTLPGRTDQVIGSIGGQSDYLKRVLCPVSNSAASRVVLKEGNPAPKKTLTTHASTASTTTVLNTAINVESVVADQYKDHLVRVDGGRYSKILTHAAFAANAVNSYTLDEALPVAPGTGKTIVIEFPEWVAEILPNGAPVQTHIIPIERHCTGPGWRISTNTGVGAISSGDFDHV